MGKKKNKNKVSGAVKTAVKTEKKLANKLKKELANLGEVSSYMLFIILKITTNMRTTTERRSLERTTIVQ